MKRLPAALAAIALWAALAILPGYLVGTGAVGVIHPDGSISGTAALTWFIGYLVSLAALPVVGIAAGHSQRWWYIGGSMLPWIMDFTAAFSTGGAVPVAVVVGLHGVAMGYLVFHVLRSQAGTLVTATVVKVLPPFLHMNLVENSVYLHRRVLVSLPGPDGTSYQAKVGVLTEIGDDPSPGDSFPVLVDPHNPRRVTVAPGAMS